MASGSTQQAKTRQQIENELMEILREAQAEWSVAADEYRLTARQRFMSALQPFNSFVLDGKVASEGKLPGA